MRDFSNTNFPMPAALIAMLGLLACTPGPGGEAGEVNAIFVTLIASCQMHELEPWSYLRDLLCVLPHWPRRRVLELAPAYWRETLEKGEAQQLLGADVCRRVMLEVDRHATAP